MATLTKGGLNLLTDVRDVLNDFLNDLGVKSIDEAQLNVLEQVLSQVRNRR